MTGATLRKEAWGTRAGSRVAVIVAMLSTVGCDRVTKQVAVGHLAGASWQSCLGDIVRIGYAENTGELLGLLFSGGISNWIDRVTRGSVLDFMNIGIGPLRTGIFNVADVPTFLGVGLLLLGERDPRDEGGDGTPRQA